MSQVLAARDAIATYLTSELATPEPRVSVTVHGGGFKVDDLRAYAKNAPAVVVSMLGFDTGATPPDLSADVDFLITVVTKPRKGDDRNDQAVVLADRVSRLVKRSPWLDEIRGTRRPAKVAAKNMFSRTLDELGISMWSIGWEQTLDLLEDSEEAVPFESFHADWDVYPRDDGADLNEVKEAEDDVEIEQS